MACESRGVACHGYGAWPEWMDGGVREREELGRVQRIVKENKRRNRRAMLRRQRDERERERAQSTRESVVVETHDQRDPDPPQPFRSSHVEEVEPGVLFHDEMNGLSTGPRTTEVRDSAITTPTTTPSTPAPSSFRFGHAREAELLMHYLDHVFALQFRFHTPTVATGGRGWLLWLLTETKPLYHAALSLGALHQHSLLSRASRGRKYYESLNELNEHHNRALQELQIFLQSAYDDSNSLETGRKRKLQILACGVQLISFEVWIWQTKFPLHYVRVLTDVYISQLFRGGISEWQVHLQALATVVSSIEFTNHPSFTNTPNTPSSTPLDTPPEGQTPLPDLPEPTHDLEGTAERFLIGAVVWFDIIACASTGNRPLLHHEHNRLLLTNQLDLSNIAGCASWAAHSMGEIAALRAWKRDRLATNTLSMWQLFDRADAIRNTLANGIAALNADIAAAFEALRDSHNHHPHSAPTPVPPSWLPDPAKRSLTVKRAVTLVFARAAQVYLHTTISGSQSSVAEVRTSVSDTAAALRDLRAVAGDAQAVRSLVWPICVAGSMAEGVGSGEGGGGLQGFFKALIDEVGYQAHDFGNTKTVLGIMERCWEGRRMGVGVGGKGWDWATAMEESGQRVLLV